LTVQTVTGPIAADELGRVLMHEHVITRSPGLSEAYPSTYPRAEVLATCVDGLSALKDAGIGTLVDHTTYDLGRDVELLAEASRASGVAIVAATGVWIEPQRYWHRRAPAEGAQLLIGDLETGIAGTDIRAGVIKCATDRAGLTPAVERALRACAIAHRATGVYLSTHTHVEGRTGLDQQHVLAEEGVDLGRVVIGHSGDTTDLDHLRELLDAGSYLGMDRFGVQERLPDADRMDVVATLCREGHCGRLLLSHDASFWTDLMPMEARRRHQPRWHHRHLMEEILPGLRERGVSDAQLETMLVSSPRTLLVAGPAYPGEPSPAARRHEWD
jgi:phosphotriesterase-related protein